MTVSLAGAVLPLAGGDYRSQVDAVVCATLSAIMAELLNLDSDGGLAALPSESASPGRRRGSCMRWIAELVEEYADFPLGETDASAVALAKRIGATVVITLDHRQFAVVTPRHGVPFELVP